MEAAGSDGARGRAVKGDKRVAMLAALMLAAGGCKDRGVQARDNTELAKRVPQDKLLSTQLGGAPGPAWTLTISNTSGVDLAYMAARCRVVDAAGHELWFQTHTRNRMAAGEVVALPLRVRYRLPDEGMIPPARMTCEAIGRTQPMEG